tara:strand:- start:12057 stop:12830 length:774 start_codon:yes stop_codon:yes gene_type:complete
MSSDKVKSNLYTNTSIMGKLLNHEIQLTEINKKANIIEASKFIGKYIIYIRGTIVLHKPLLVFSIEKCQNKWNVLRLISSTGIEYHAVIDYQQTNDKLGYWEIYKGTIDKIYNNKCYKYATEILYRCPYYPYRNSNNPRMCTHYNDCTRPRCYYTHNTISGLNSNDEYYTRPQDKFYIKPLHNDCRYDTKCTNPLCNFMHNTYTGYSPSHINNIYELSETDKINILPPKLSLNNIHQSNIITDYLFNSTDFDLYNKL